MNSICCTIGTVSRILLTAQNEVLGYTWNAQCKLTQLVVQYLYLGSRVSLQCIPDKKGINWRIQNLPAVPIIVFTAQYEIKVYTWQVTQQFGQSAGFESCLDRGYNVYLECTVQVNSACSPGPVYTVSFLALTSGASKWKIILYFEEKSLTKLVKISRKPFHQLYLNIFPQILNLEYCISNNTPKMEPKIYNHVLKTKNKSYWSFFVLNDAFINK